MLPGLMRTLAMPFSTDCMASRWLKWMSATSGTGLPSTRSRTARAQASLYTDTRTMSAPAAAMARIWARVASTSRVSVLVMV